MFIYISIQLALVAALIVSSALSAPLCTRQNDVQLSCRVSFLSDEFISELTRYNSGGVESLTIECMNNETESSISEWNLGGFHQLTSLSLVGCIFKYLPDDWTAMRRLRTLQINTHTNQQRLPLNADSFSGLRRLEHLDLSNSNIEGIAHELICKLPYLESLNLSSNSIASLYQAGIIASGSEDARSQCRVLFLSVLDLSNNIIKSLTPNTLSRFQSLTEIILGGNQLKKLDSSAFIGLKNLVHMDLSGNMISSLSTKVFQETPLLRRLRLNDNDIRSLYISTSGNLKHLERLDLSANKLTTRSLSLMNFSNLPSLKYLVLSRNQLNAVDRMTFSGLEVLEQLDLNYNMLKYIPQGAFSNLPLLRILDLSYNEIEEVSDYSMGGLNAIHKLDMSGNYLAKIPATIFTNKSQLDEIILDNNQLVSLPKFPRSLSNLKVLSANNNSIKMITNDSFEHLTSLYSLNLNDNALTILNNTAFSPLQRLRILCFSRNRIERIDPQVLSALSSIEALRLDANNLVSLNSSLTELHKLKWLNISDNSLSYLNFSQFPTAIEWLDMHNNSIERIINIPSDFVNNIKIKTLDIGFNRLTSINDKQIPTSVEQLLLNDNLISSVEQYTFFSLENLSRVDLFANRLESVDINAFRLNSASVSRQTPQFYIGGNPYVCDCNMEWLFYHRQMTGNPNYPSIVDLESVYCRLKYSRQMSYVPLVEADVTMFLCSYETHCFATCHCCEFDACDCEMTCPDKCSCYHDQSWTKNIIDCSNSGLTAIPESLPIDATDLYLDGNAINNISSFAFLGRKNIKAIYLNGSKVEHIAENAFAGLPDLSILHLDSNELTSIDRSHLLGPYRLRQLHLKNNRISQIADDSFQHLAQLETLSLNDNELTSFDVNVLLENNLLKSVALNNNIWSCECNFLQKLLSYARISGSIVDLDSLSCQLPTGAYLQLKLTETEMVCDHFHSYAAIRLGGEHSSYFSAFIAVFLLLGITCCLTVIMFLFRSEIRAWVFSKCGIRICYHHAPDEDESKAFDAFVSYSEMDAPFIHHVLAVKMESGDSPYRLALLHRDFPYCDYLSNIVADSINFSQRTLVVLSKHFIEHEWSQFPLRLAHANLLNQRRKQLIVIMLGDITMKDLDAELKGLIRGETCIHTSDKQFWDKLRFALPSLNCQMEGSFLPYSHYSEIYEAK